MREVIGRKHAANGGIDDAISFFLADIEDRGATLYREYLRKVDRSQLRGRRAQVAALIAAREATVDLYQRRSRTVSGSLAGAQIGEQLDEHVLDRYQCTDCEHIFS